MYGSGHYPAGTEYDPCAPWNEKEPHMVKCEACNGKGYYDDDEEEKELCELCCGAGELEYEEDYEPDYDN